MRYNQFGNTGLFVSEICLGTMTFGAPGANGVWGTIASLGQEGVDQIVVVVAEGGLVARFAHAEIEDG